MTSPTTVRVSGAVIATGLRAYSKLLVAVAFTLAATIATLVDSGGSVVQWLQVLAQAAVLAGTYVASTTVPGARYAKLVTTAIGAALAVLIPVLLEGGSGFTGGTLVNMVAAVLGVLGVYSVADRLPDGTNVLAVAAVTPDGAHVITDLRADTIGDHSLDTAADEEARRSDPL